MKPNNNTEGMKDKPDTVKETKPTKYVLGFLFTDDLEKVWLIRKLRPQWQFEKLNGIGGHVEPNETPDQAMVREFKEETGVVITDWRWFMTMKNDEWEVECYYQTIRNNKTPISMTDESVHLIPVYMINEVPVITNLRRIIPNIIDIMENGIGYQFTNVWKQSASLQSENERLKEQIEGMKRDNGYLLESLQELIQVKDWKDKYGKDEHYIKAMPLAWKNAKELVSEYESK